MTYLPPSSRMRAIKRKAQTRRRPAAPAAPANVDEALATVGKEPEVKVKVGFMEATVTAGPDGEFGTADDKVEIKAAGPGGPSYSMRNTKVELLAIAGEIGVAADDSMTKAEIIEALDKASG